MNVWFTADTHFGHRAMARDGKGWRPFDTVAEHDAHLIDRWNSVVKTGDQVWHLGDVGLGSDSYILECVGHLNGHKHLVAGNHDAVWSGHRRAHDRQRRWLEAFDSIQTFARRRIGRGREYLLSHFPYVGDRGPERYAQYRLRDEGLWLVHGHVHTEWTVRERMINVGVDAWDFTPVALDHVVSLMNDEGERI